MMRMLSCKILPTAVVIALLISAAVAVADCPMHKQAKSGYSSGTKTSAGYSTEKTGSTYLGQYQTHDASCLFDEMRRDHREIRAHMNAISEGPMADRGRHWTELRQELLPYMQATERTFYPALADTRSGRMAGLIGEEEQSAAAAVFQKLDGGDVTSDRWTARFIVFKEMVEHQFVHQENQIFRAARRSLNREQLSNLCNSFMDQRQIAASNISQITQPASFETSTSSAQSVSSIYEQCVGFDDLATQDMPLRCPTCGVVVGTITPVSSTCVIWESTAAPETATAQTEEAQPATPVQEQATPDDIMPRGTLHCPGCGAAMGGVCPSGPAAAAEADMMATPETPTGMEAAPNGTAAPSTDGGAKY